MASAGWGTSCSNRRAAARWLLLLTRAASTDVGAVVAEKARRAAVTRPVVLRLVLLADCDDIIVFGLPVNGIAGAIWFGLVWFGCRNEFICNNSSGKEIQTRVGECFNVEGTQ